MNNLISFPVPTQLVIAYICQGRFARAISAYRVQSRVTLANGQVAQMRLKSCNQYLRAIREGLPIMPMAVSEDNYIVVSSE